MKRFLTVSLLAVALLGCHSSSTTPPAALAPGYTSEADQQFGTALAAARALAAQAVQDYGKLTPPQQAPVKNPLNAFVAAVNAADAAYTAYHAGQGSAAQVQAAMSKVSTTQAAYTAVATGGK